MKRRINIVLLALLMVVLSGCSEDLTIQKSIPVSILEAPGFTVENNGQFVNPGEDAVFYVTADSGLSVVGTDYLGDYSTQLENGKIKLTFKAVKYPSRVALQLSEHFVNITYVSGSDGSGITLPCDTSLHPRPNTANSQLFTREGYTLESWNTKPDGSGERIGLGSRVTVDGELTLYAQWARWSDEENFTWTADENGATVTGYLGNEDVVAIPGRLDGQAVVVIAANAFQNCRMSALILPDSLKTVEDGAFQNCSLGSLTLFDNIVNIRDAAFADCKNLQTLFINALEKPYGTAFRRESCYADKVDMLILSRGQKKILFYGGCAVWYNLDGSQLSPLTGQGYRVINLGINGLVNSAVQLQILENYLEEGDIFFHTPELSSEKQMMLDVSMKVKDDNKLWCGLEYNYDLFALVDLRTVPGALDSFSGYLATKKAGTEYNSVFTENGHMFYDEYGCIPFPRDTTETDLPDRVYLDASFISKTGMERLQAFYRRFQAKGVRVYLSYACVNMDDVPDDQKAGVGMMDTRFREAVAAMNGPTLVSNLEDYLYTHGDFYDTNYHLRSETARENTLLWLRDLQAQMTLDGLWRTK